MWSVTFGLVAGIEVILDISQHILAEKGIKVESYGQIPNKMKEARVIDHDFAGKMQQMIGFRNRAIHNYPSLEEGQLYEILQEGPGDFKEFLNFIKDLIG